MRPNTSDPADYPATSAWTIDIDAADDRTLAAAFADNTADHGDLADVAAEEQALRFSPTLVHARSGAPVLTWPRWTPPTADEALQATRATAATAARAASGATHAARTALGLASLVAERLRERAGEQLREAPMVGDGVALGIGLLQQAGDGLRALGQRVLGPRGSLVERARSLAERVPGAELPARTAARLSALPGPWRGAGAVGGWVGRLGLEVARASVARAVEQAQRRGRDTVDAGRQDARALVRTGLDQSLKWAHERALPPLIDGFVPYLIDSVMPRIIDGSLPQIRATVVPAIIDELSSSQQLRELVVDQGRDLVDDAADHLRGRTARADDRVEAAFHRLVRHPEATIHEEPSPDPTTTDGSGQPPWADDR